MTTKNTLRVNPKKKELWESRIKEWETSGLSKTLFCKQRSISKSSFWKWYSQLAEKFKKNKSEDLFVPIKIKKEKIESASSFLILLKGNVKISISNDVDESTLKMLLEILGVLPC